MKSPKRSLKPSTIASERSASASSWPTATRLRATFVRAHSAHAASPRATRRLPSARSVERSATNAKRRRRTKQSSTPATSPSTNARRPRRRARLPRRRTRVQRVAACHIAEHRCMLPVDPPEAICRIEAHECRWAARVTLDEPPAMRPADHGCRAAEHACVESLRVHPDELPQPPLCAPTPLECTPAGG